LEGRQPPVDLLGEDQPVRFLRALLVLPLVAVAAACTTSGGGGSSTPSPSRTTTSAAAKVVAPPTPRNGACYRLTSAQLARPSSTSRPVPCSAQHTARTIFVGRLDTLVDGHSLAVDSDRAQRQLATTCPRKLASFVGGAPKTRELSRFNVVWFSPTIGQAARGADWFRCDVIAFADVARLYPLPPGPRLKGALNKPDSLATYGLCGSTAPGAPGFQRLICARPHAWAAFDTVPLSGGKAYPGAASVRIAGDAVCKARAKARAANNLKFRYGWEWPNRDQWLGGQHYGYCWSPG
jgi:hypothetical protein